MHSYGKILNLGHKQLQDLLNGEVTIEEKVDGSQFSAQLSIDGEMKFRSRGRILELPVEDKLFKPVVEYFLSIRFKLKTGWIYRGEAICRPKHNTITYGRVPKHNVVIFDIDRGEQDYLTHEEKVEEATRLDLEVVPLLYRGEVLSSDELKSLTVLTSELSFLYAGTAHPMVEGIVIKNYSQFGRDHRVLMGKLVREELREDHRKNWKNEHPNRGDIINKLTEIYRHENRWLKAVQHLNDAGSLEGDARDIGKIIKEVQSDVMGEGRDEIVRELFKWAWKQISKGIVRGIPEWYKAKLAEVQPTMFEKKEEGK